MSLNRFDMVSEVSQSARSAAHLLYISTAKYGGDWLSVPHTHACAELFYVVSGQGSFSIDGETYPVSKDDLVIINPFVEHTETSLKSQPLEYIVLGVDGLELLVGDSENRNFYISHMHTRNSAMQTYLRDMLQEIESQAPGYETICQNFLEILIIRVMRSSDYSARLVPTQTHASKESATVRRYIDGHFKEPLTLDLLADLVHINKYHMAHSFTRDYGISPINYLLSLRLQESRTLLQSTNLSMTQIARIIGFSSPCYFSQIFKKSLGISPSAYRSSMRRETAKKK